MSCKTKLLIIAGAILLGCQIGRAQIDVGAKFPELSAVHFEGALPSDLHGSVVLVDFWASWCAPCKASFPALNKISEEFSARGLRVVGVSVDERRPPFEAFVGRLKPSFAVVRDARQELVGQVKVPTMPTSYLVDRTGKVRFVHRGFHDHTDEELRREIAGLLEEKP
jgi:thiol-disulfide isomerase/thioredoxin